MESYVEATFVMNVVMMCICCLVSAMFLGYPLLILRTMILSCFFVGYLMMAKDAWGLIVFGEIIFATAVFRHGNKAMLIAIALRVTCLLSCLLLFQGEIEGMVWYVPLEKTYLIVFVVILGGAVLYCLPVLSNHYVKKHYIYDVEIRLHGFVLKGQGYLDSGNIACSHGCPVVFIARKSFESLALPDHLGEIVKIRTLNGSGQILCYRASIEVNGYQKREVLIGLMEEIKVKKDCDVLLNVKLFQVR